MDDGWMMVLLAKWREETSGGKDWQPEIGLPKGEGAGQSNI